MRCYCVALLNEKIARLKEEMFEAVDKYGYDHPLVHVIASMIDPLVNSLAEVQLYRARLNQATKWDCNGNRCHASQESPSVQAAPDHAALSLDAASVASPRA